MRRIHILHENPDWVAPLVAALQKRGLPYADWFLNDGVLALDEVPPKGVFYNRMSASSHTRDHRYAPELTAQVLAWLESHDRRVLNGGRALALEISKAAQYTALRRHGVPTPRTFVVSGRDAIGAAAARLDGPLILKHNRAGKGLGVRLFEAAAAAADYAASDEFEAPVDGLTLVQDYIQAPEPFITRMEFIGGRFLYAVRVDTSRGFQLCPADVCAVDGGSAPMFHIVPDFHHALIGPVEALLRANGVHMAGVEFIIDQDGRAYVYDINTNTNYNPEAEAAAGVSGMAAMADYLGQQLAADDAAAEAA